MEFRSLDITVISAEDLKNVNLFCRMAVYAVVSVEKTKCKTHADREGGRNPRWSHRLKFSVDTAAAARNPNLVLIFKLRSENFFFGHRDVGNVVIPVANLLAPIAMAPSSSFSPTNSEQVVDYQVRTPAGKPKGTLKFAYKFGDKPKTGGSAPLPTPPPNVTAPPSCSSIPTPYNVLPPPPQPLPQPLYPMVYPQHHPLLGYGYPLPQPPMPQGYGPGPGPSYGYMPLPGYGGYGLERPQESRCGGGGSLMGAGAGLGLGLVGGMLIGGMMSEVGEMTAEAVEMAAVASGEMAVAAGEMASYAGYEAVDAVFDI